MDLFSNRAATCGYNDSTMETITSRSATFPAECLAWAKSRAPIGGTRNNKSGSPGTPVNHAGTAARATVDSFLEAETKTWLLTATTIIDTHGAEHRLSDYQLCSTGQAGTSAK